MDSLTKIKSINYFLLLQLCPYVSKSFHVFFFGDLHLSATLNLSMFVGCNTSVETGIRFGYLLDLHFGILTLVHDGDTTTRGDLPPFALHPLHTGDWVTSDLGDEGCSAL